VAENMGFRCFDEPGFTALGWAVRRGPLRRKAVASISEYKIKAPSPEAPIGGLSGGNVQRAVLARELHGEINVLIAANPVFGLDFAAVKEIHTRLRGVRDQGGAVLLISEDLDELLELADRIVVMSEGRIVFETPGISTDRQTIGAHMGGGH
jgi:simple sugar transport system ATP-binding protein